MGRGPFFVVEKTRHHANIFAVLVGKTNLVSRDVFPFVVWPVFFALAPFLADHLIENRLSRTCIRDDAFCSS